MSLSTIFICGWLYLVFQNTEYHVCGVHWKTKHILLLYEDDRHGMNDNFNDCEASQLEFCEHLCLISEHSQCKGSETLFIKCYNTQN